MWVHSGSLLTVVTLLCCSFQVLTHANVTLNGAHDGGRTCPVYKIHNGTHGRNDWPLQIRAPDENNWDAVCSLPTEWRNTETAIKTPDENNSDGICDVTVKEEKDIMDKTPDETNWDAVSSLPTEWRSTETADETSDENYEVTTTDSSTFSYQSVLENMIEEEMNKDDEKAAVGSFDVFQKNSFSSSKSCVFDQTNVLDPKSPIVPLSETASSKSEDKSDVNFFSGLSGFYLWILRSVYRFNVPNSSRMVYVLMLSYPFILMITLGCELFAIGRTGNAFISRMARKLTLSIYKKKKFYKNQCVDLKSELLKAQKYIISLNNALLDCKSDVCRKERDFMEAIKRIQNSFAMEKLSSKKASTMELLCGNTIFNLEETLTLLKGNYDLKVKQLERMERKLKRTVANETSLVLHLAEIEKLSSEIAKNNQTVQNELMVEKRKNMRLETEVVELSSRNKLFIENFIETAVTSIKETVVEAYESSSEDNLHERIENLLKVTVEGQFMNETCEKRIHELQNQLVESDERNNTLINELDTKNKALDNLEDKLRSIQMEHSHLKSFSEDQSKNLFKLEAKYKEELEILNDKYLDAQDLLVSKVNFKEKLALATKELASQEKSFTLKKHELEGEISTLNLELANMRRNYEQLLAERDYLREKINNDQIYSFAIDNSFNRREIDGEEGSKQNTDEESDSSSEDIPEPPPMPDFFLFSPQFMQMPALLLANNEISLRDYSRDEPNTDEKTDQGS